MKASKKHVRHSQYFIQKGLYPSLESYHLKNSNSNSVSIISHF